MEQHKRWSPWQDVNRKLSPYFAFSFRLIALSVYTSSFELPWNSSIYFCTSKDVVADDSWAVVSYHSQNLSNNVSFASWKFRLLTFDSLTDIPCKKHCMQSRWHLASSARRHLTYWIPQDTSSDSGSVFPLQNIFNVLWSLHFLLPRRSSWWYSSGLLLHPNVYLPTQNLVFLQK